MNNSVAVSIIIVNYNTTQLTIDCLRSVISFTKVPYEIIVVDNASSDRSIEQIPVEFPNVTLISQNENVGFGRANNSAIKICRGKYIFLLNSDTYLLNDAVDIFYKFMENRSNLHVGCCGGDLFNLMGVKQVAYGNFPSLLEAFSVLGFKILYRDYFNRNISSGVVNNSQVNLKVDYICGADMFFRKSVLDEIGVFDPRFFLYFEETELSFRMHAAGYISMLLPSAKIVHLEGASQGDQNELNFVKTKRFAESRTLYFKICYGLMTAFLIKIIYAIQALLFSISKRKIGYIKSAEIIIRS
jgi:GT2 family glycosyltransferase